MKKRKITLGLLVLMLSTMVLSSCSTTDVQYLGSIDLLNRNFDNSGCKEKEDARIMSTPTEERELINYSATEDGYLIVTHINAMFACGSNGEIKTQATLDQDTRTINIQEVQTGNVFTDCMCAYDLRTEFGKLADGDYKVVINKHITFPIKFSKDLKGSYEVKEK